MNQQISQDCLGKYIGIKYDNMDCFELVRLFYDNEFSIEIPDQHYSNNTNHVEIDLIANNILEKFEKVDSPNPGDIVLLRVWGMPVHIGIFIDKNHVLHTSRKTGSVIEKINPKWTKRIEGFYRWQSLK